MPYSNYIVYVDESGDHGLENINPENPVFVLSFCVFEKNAYRTVAVPAVQALKFEYWGHDAIVLHSHEIRNRRNDFRILNDRNTRARFMDSLNAVMQQVPVTIIAAAIDKNKLRRQYAYPANPYAMSLTFCIERLQRFLSEHREDQALTYLLVECRGKKEDDALELEFRRLCAGGTYAGRITNMDIRFMDKKHNSTGLQIADLTAYPIARHTINPAQPNRAYDIVQEKFRRSWNGIILGFGLKQFP